MRRRVFLLVGAALAGCAGPRRDAPPAAVAPVPQHWRTPGPAGAGLQPDWWQLFGDATLDALVTEALAHNDDLAAAATRVRQARAQLGAAHAQQGPAVQAALDGGRSRSVNPGFGIPEDQSAGEAMIQASYDVDLFGRLAATSAAAQSAVLASAYAAQTMRLAVAATVVSTYCALQAQDARLAIVQATLALRRTELHVTERRLGQGYTTALDLTRAQAEVEASAQLVPALELAIAMAENAMAVLLGRAPGPIVRTAFEDTQLPDVPVALPSALLRHRPDIAALEARLAATDHQLDAARAAFLPDIRLAASGGWVGSTLVDASPVGVWSLGSSILAPLFDSGRLQAQQDSSTARRDEAAFAYRKGVLQALREVEDSLAATGQYARQYASIARQRAILARTAALATRRYRAGYTNYLEQLDAQRALLSAELAQVQARLDRCDASVRLIQALGGGWTAARVDVGYVGDIGYVG